MNRSVSTAIALTLGFAVSAAVALRSFAQENQAADDSPESARDDQSDLIELPVRAQQENASEQLPGGRDRRSLRGGSLSISASEKTNPDTITVEKTPEIEVDSSNVLEIPKSAIKPFSESKRELKLTSDLPASALASRLEQPEAETVPVWRPAFASQGFRATRLDAFALSQDGSVLAIAESTGTFLGPNGTRLVLINTSNWQVIRIVLTDRMLKKLVFIPGSDELAALAFPQSVLKQPFGVLRIKLNSGTAADFNELPFPFNERIAPEQIALTPVPNGVFCSGFFGTKVFFVPRFVKEDAEVPYFTFETSAPASALTVTPDGDFIAAISQKFIEFYRISDASKANDARRQSFTTLDLGWSPVDAHFLGGARTDFIVCPAYKEDSPPVIFRSSAKVSLDGRSAGYAVPMNNGQIGVAFKTRGRIDIVEASSLDASDSVILEQLRPPTNGDISFVFYLSPIRAFCVIDSNGNCFAAGRRDGEKRWSKRIIWNGGAGKR